MMKRMFTKYIPSTKQQMMGKLIKPEQNIQLSEEQQHYIQYDISNKDTILQACAGSGKTRCILEKMKYLTIRGILTKKEIMVFSYSRLTIQHMKITCSQYIDNEVFCDQKLLKTIDAFCYDILGKIKGNDEQCAVQILSSKLNQLIIEQPEIISKIIKKSKYRNIKVLFIDEAQDLNEIQYNIVLFVKKCVNCTIHLIGDPNQNIYQFRESYEHFMLNHPNSQKFQLTQNFRCNEQINSFAKYFQFYRDDQDLLQWNNKPIIDLTSQIKIHIDSSNNNDQSVIQLIENLRKQGYKYNNIAVLSPVVGDQFNSGIKRIANILDNSKIPYISYYNESKEDSQKKVTTKSKQQGIHLLTIHGSKGLEFPVVILLKLSDSMMLSETFEQQDYVAQNMNLIYVAITRAKDQLIIIHDNSNNIKNRHICSLMIQVPKTLYQCDGNIENHYDIIKHKIEERRSISDENTQYIKNHYVNDKKDILLVSKYLLPDLYALNQKEVMFTNSLFSWKTSVTRFIQGMKSEDMLLLMDNLMFKKKHSELFEISYNDKKLFKDIRNNQEALIGILFEQMFHYQIQFIKNPNHTPKIYKLIFTLKDRINNIKINQYFCIENKQQLMDILYIYDQVKLGVIDQQTMNTQFNQIATIIISELEYGVIRDKQQNNQIEFIDFGSICSNQLNIMRINIHFIFDSIDQYNQGLHWNNPQQLKAIIYTTMIKYAIKSKHQKYIHYDNEFINQLCQFQSLFEKLEKSATELSKQDIYYQYEVGNDDINGYIDFIAHDPETQENTIIEFKVVNDLSTDHILQLLIYDFLLEQDKQTSMNNRLIIFNALKGVCYEILVEQKEALFNLIGQIFDKDHSYRINTL